ncbi:RHS repeat domain-containing protein, partial [Marispirochaeta aestuarii]|uniref:hypothetical protein n=1 Tax=Marispirochaeta aestuarii TaxID=1963862 RepID=UPI001301C1C5
MRIRGIDLTGNRTAVIDKNGNTTVFEYDALNRLIKQTDPLNTTIRYEYEPRGLVGKRTDRNGGTVLFTYNSLGTIVTATDPAGKTIETTYNETSQPCTRKDRNGNTTTFEYDPLNRLIITRDPYGHETRRSYNYLGLVAAITDPLGNTRTFDHDPAGRLVKVTDPLGGTKQYTYDPAGNLISYQDEMERETGYTYDQLNRLKSTTNALGENYSYTYDENGNLRAEIDGEAKAHSYEYDKLNRIIQEIDRLGNTQSYTYDAEGNILSKKDFNGDQSEYFYDKLNRRIETRFANGETKRFEYDPAGNLVGAENGEKALSFAYDPVNRLTEASDGLLNETTRYAYDPAGNRIRAERKKANRITTYTYGKANELLSVTDPDGKTTGYRYDALGRETYRTTPNDVVTETVYDPAGRISAIKSYEKKRGHNTVLYSFAYLYNEAGEQTFRIDEKGEVMSFAYDEAGRIAEVRYPFESGKPETDFEQRLNFGLYPEEKTSTSRGNKRHGDGDEGMSFALPQVDNDHELKERLKERSVPRMGVYKKYRGLSSHEHPRWHVTPGEGATPFATRLNLDPETKNQLQDAYREINPYSRRFNDHQYQWTETFGYDTRNNLSTSANGWGRVDYSYDEAHRLKQTGNRNYLHDKNGNLIKEYLGEEDGPLSADYTYTPENRIAQIETHFEGFLPGQLEADSGVRYTYDALGRRSSRASYLSKSYGFSKQLEWNRESTETYLYEALSFDILVEYRDTEYEVNRRSRHFFPSF